MDFRLSPLYIFFEDFVHPFFAVQIEVFLGIILIGIFLWSDLHDFIFEPLVDFKKPMAIIFYEWRVIFRDIPLILIFLRWFLFGFWFLTSFESFLVLFNESLQQGIRHSPDFFNHVLAPHRSWFVFLSTGLRIMILLVTPKVLNFFDRLFIFSPSISLFEIGLISPLSLTQIFSTMEQALISVFLEELSGWDCRCPWILFINVPPNIYNTHNFLKPCELLLT